MKYCLLTMSLFLLVSCGNQYHILDRPVIFDENRIKLTRDYLKDRYGLIQDTPTITPKMIVLHWTEIPTLEQSYVAFLNSTLPNFRPEIKSVSGLNVSSHFLVDLDGSIYRLMPEIFMARHVIGLNHTAIGIENVGGTPNVPLTKAQIKANIWLVEYLSKKYPIEYLIGHYEYTKFEDDALWLEVDEGYRTQKVDPGPSFLNAVRQGSKKLKFKSIPTQNKS